MKSFFAPLVALVLLCAAVPIDASRAAELTRAARCLDGEVCPGCGATAWTDPVTGMNNGVQIISTTGPYGGRIYTTNLRLDVEPGNCVMAPDHQGNLRCSANNNCIFTTKGKVGSFDAFRDDSCCPCKRSALGDFPAPGVPFETVQMQVLEMNYSWLGSCSGGVTSLNIRFFRNASASHCNDGEIIGEIQFAGKCENCSD